MTPVKQKEYRNSGAKGKFILFDFDGVILDSFKQAFETIQLIYPCITEDQYRSCFEGNINNWKEHLGVCDEDCREGVDFFTEYIPRVLKHSKIFPEMRDAIFEVEKQYSLMIVSSSTTVPIQSILERSGLLQSFSQILGNDVHVSKVEKIKMIFDEHGAGADDCVFVTDTIGDMHEARKMNVGSIGVTRGFQSAETLLRGNPFRVAEKPHELIPAITEYFESMK